MELADAGALERSAGGGGGCRSRAVGLTVGSDFRVQARVRLGAIRPDDVAVELYLGRVGADDEMTDAVALPMQPVGGRDGVWVFEAKDSAVPAEADCMATRFGFCRSTWTSAAAFCRG